MVMVYTGMLGYGMTWYYVVWHVLFSLVCSLLYTCFVMVVGAVAVSTGEGWLATINSNT